MAISFNGSNQFNNPIWLTQGFHPVYSGLALGFSINNEYVRYPNYSFPGASLVLDGSGRSARIHLYTYDNDSIGTKNEPFKIDEENNIIMQSPDYMNNGNVFIGNNTGSARLLVHGYEVTQCYGTLNCSAYDEATCLTKTEVCGTAYSCAGSHSSCDTYDGGSESSCIDHDCSYTAGFCGGVLDCIGYGDGDCQTRSQCYWNGASCENNGACGNLGDGDCQNHNGCTWNPSDCYGDSHVCQQTECDASTDGCYNQYLSCENTYGLGCSNVLYANCNDYNGCNQTVLYPNISTSIDVVGFGQVDDAYQCLDSAGIKQSFFDYTCAFATNLPIKSNVNISGNLVVEGNFSAKRPYAMFSDNTTQVIGVASTAQVVNFSTTEDDYLITLTNKQNISVQQSGDYYIDVSAIYAVDLPNKHVEFWLQKSTGGGAFVNVPRSNTKMELPTANIEIPLAVSFIIDLMPTDKIRFMTASDDAGSSIVYTTNTSYSPETPSIIINMFKISEITP